MKGCAKLITHILSHEQKQNRILWCHNWLRLVQTCNITPLCNAAVYKCGWLIALCHSITAGTDYRTCSAAQPPRQPRTWCSRVWEKMLVAQTAAAAGSNQHSVARNAFVFVLKTDNFWFVLRHYSSASEHIRSLFAACLLTVHTSEHHVLACHVRLCRRICSTVCTDFNSSKTSDNIILFQVMSVFCHPMKGMFCSKVTDDGYICGPPREHV